MLPLSGQEPAGPRPAGSVSTFTRARLAFTRARLAFRQWRRTRPFWGGLFLLLSGVEMYVSAHMDFLPVKATFGSQGFLSWLIPLAVLLCGILTWLTPGQRIFYGVVGAAVAVAALMGLNLGGFFVGMVLGIAGGALATSWVPDTGSGRPSGPPPAPPEDVETTDVLPTGPLTDQLPTSPTSPLGTPPVHGSGRHAASRPEPPNSRLLTLLLLVLAVTGALLALPPPAPAAAAPCPSATSGGTAPKPAPSASPSTSPSPSPSATGGGNPVDDFFTGLGRWLGITPPAADTPSGSPSPSPSVSASSPKPAPTTACPSASPRTGTKAPAAPRRLAAAPGQPKVNKVPSTQISALLSETGVTFDGVVELPTVDGVLRALQFTLASASSKPFELRVLTPGGTLSLKSSNLTVSGNVRFYATRIQGKALGVLPVDYTPDSPPLLVPPIIFFTEATVQLAFVHANRLEAPDLRISYL